MNKATWHTRKELGIPYENCPFCGEKLQQYEKGVYYCGHGDTEFSDEDLEHEELRHVLSAYICNLTPETAMKCHIQTKPTNEVDAPIVIDKVYESYDGTQFAHYHGTPETDWVDLEDFCNDALKDIVDFFVR